MKMKKGFTLMEILIVTALIALIATAALIIINPMQQINKGFDSQRKHDLDVFKKALEDYYNDKGCYPKPNEICYDLPPTIDCVGAGHGTLIGYDCHICGKETNSPNFPYLSKLPCDPQHKLKRYLYEVAPKSSGLTCDAPADPEDPTSCPQWYRVYSNIGDLSDPAIKELGCQGSFCGSAPNFGYDYGVSSPNQKLNYATTFYYFTKVKTCDSCSPYSQCVSLSGGETIYATHDQCCTQHHPPPVSGCN